jgi:hypothetical protein
MLPAEGLIEIEKFFQVPALGVILGQGIDRVAIRRREKSIEVPLIGAFPLPLHQFVIGAATAVVGRVR